MIFEVAFGNIICIALTIVIVLIAYYKWTYQYWYRRNLPYLEPTIPYGNIVSPFNRKEHLSLELKRFYDEMKSRGWKHGGFYMVLSPSYLILDLDYLRNVLTKDFQHFVDRGRYSNEKDDPLSASLVALGGQEWRCLRTKVSPIFTPGKMKMMFQTLLDCIPDLLQKVETYRLKQVSIDIKEIMSCFTSDVIGVCVFGLDCNSCKDENSPFRKYGRKFFLMDKYRLIQRFFFMTFPKAAQKLGVMFTPQDVSDFFLKIVRDVIDYREKNNDTRKDFIQLLIEHKDNDRMNILTTDEIAAQCFAFFVAGFETSAATMSFALYELSKNQEIQDKIRDEINAVLAKCDGKINYESIHEMKYMDLVINETLRKYPPISSITRKCSKDYKIPDEDIVIEKGTMVFIPVFAIHHDKDYYPEPQKFDPERFTEENKSKRHPLAHIPFGEGPRNCIGARFGLMQSKVGLMSLIRNYRFTVNKKTVEPIQINVMSSSLAAEGGIWLNIEKL